MASCATKIDLFLERWQNLTKRTLLLFLITFVVFIKNKAVILLSCACTPLEKKGQQKTTFVLALLAAFLFWSGLWSHSSTLTCYAYCVLFLHNNTFQSKRIKNHARIVFFAFVGVWILNFGILFSILNKISCVF